MTAIGALHIRLGIALEHAKKGLEIAAIDLQDKRRTDLIYTAIESLKEAAGPDKEELRELMEETPNA